MVVVDGLSIALAGLSLLLSARFRRLEYLFGLLSLCPYLFPQLLVSLLLLIFYLVRLRRVFPRDGIGTILASILLILFVIRFYTILVAQSPRSLQMVDHGFIVALLSSILLFSSIDIRPGVCVLPVPLFLLYVLFRVMQAGVYVPVGLILFAVGLLVYRQGVRELFWAGLILLLSVGGVYWALLGLVLFALWLLGMTWPELAMALLGFYWWWLK